MAFVESKEFTWAILYIIGIKENPFVKVPIVTDTLLAAQAVVGISPEERNVNFNGSVANHVNTQYKVYMLCGPNFFLHLDGIVEIVNAYYDYLRSRLVDHEIDRETAYSICTSVFAGTTSPKMALRALLFSYELKYITGREKPVRFEPHPIMDEDVVK